MFLSLFSALPGLRRDHKYTNTISDTLYDKYMGNRQQKVTHTHTKNKTNEDEMLQFAPLRQMVPKSSYQEKKSVLSNHGYTHTHTQVLRQEGETPLPISSLE